MSFTTTGFVDVNTGRNSASGQYMPSGNDLSIELGDITLAACGGDVETVEGHILQVMQGAVKRSVEADRITLDNDGLGISEVLQ